MLYIRDVTHIQRYVVGRPYIQSMSLDIVCLSSQELRRNVCTCASAIAWSRPTAGPPRCSFRASEGAFWAMFHDFPIDF